MSTWWEFKFISSNEQLLLASQSVTFCAAWMSVFSGWAIKYGRRKLLIVNNLFMILSWFVMLVPLYPFLILSWIMRGMAIGTFSVVVPVFIKEISYVKHRAQMISISQIMIAIGIVCWYFVSLLLPKFIPSSNDVQRDEYWSPLDHKPVTWPFVYWFPIVPAIIQLSLFIFKYQDDSPRYYDQNGAFKELFDDVFNPNEATSVSAPYSQSENATADVDRYHDTYKMLLNLKYYRATYIGIFVLVLRQFSGINMLYKYVYYYDLVKREQHGLKFVLAMINGIFTWMSFYLVKYFGRKSIMQAGFLVTWGWNALLYQFYQEDFTSSDSAYNIIINILTVFTSIIFVLSFALTVGSVWWVYSVETMTPKGFSIAVGCNWLTTFFVNLLPWIFIIARNKDDDDDQTYYKLYMSAFFFIFSALSIFGFFIILVFVQETKGKSEQEISSMYENRYFDTLKNERRRTKKRMVLKLNDTKYDL